MAQAQGLPPVYAPPGYPGSAHTGAPQYDHKQATMQANGQAMQMAPAVQGSMGPSVFAGHRDNWQFSLHVQQQPVRARMCGFGDKDRRPITPPPCVRLIVTDMRTQKEVPIDQIDASFFVLQVDLWDETGTSMKNVVKAASNSPATSISTATTTSYPPPPDRQTIYAPPPTMAYHNQFANMAYPPQQPPLAHYPPPQMYPQNPQVQQMYMPAPPSGYYAQPMAPGYPAYPGAPHAPIYPPQPQYAPVMPPQNQSAMCTRNLIGSLSVNSFQLTDPQGQEGNWFILQDLSVRTEGNFRLKMTFIDVGEKLPGGRMGTSKGKCPVLATAFSQPFQVYSAKKFPGVIESTELSKCFAGQGIKIPIRKDGGKNDNKDDDDD